MYVTVNGCRLYVDVDGCGLVADGDRMREKPTLVLVHGGPGADHSIYKPFFSQFADQVQVIYYDHRGNGRSEASTPAHWTLAQWADDLKGLCDALGLIRPIVLGVSFGGFVTLTYATRYPDHAAGLVLMSTSARMDFNEVYAAFERIGGREIRDIAEAYWEAPTEARRAAYRTHCVPYYSQSQNAPDWVKRVLWRDATALHFNGPGNEHGRMDVLDDLAQITCPTLVMVGEEDPITPPVFSDQLVAALPKDHLTYHRWPDCGHGMIGDKPDEVTAAIRAFVDSLAH